MKIHVKYYNENNIENALNDVFSSNFQELQYELKPFGIKGNSHEILTVVEITAISYFSSIIFKGFFKGFINEDFFKALGETTRNTIVNDFKSSKLFLKLFFEYFISNKLSEKKAISTVDYFEDFAIYAVLNTSKSTKELADNLPLSILQVMELIKNKKIPGESPFTIQLYPKFKTNSWDYLFIPTTQAYGNYIDRYYNLKDNKIYSINSKEEFIEKFEVNNTDFSKLIISPNLNKKH